MSESTYHLTKEDIRKVESRESRRHKNGDIPASSTAAALQSIVDSTAQNSKIDQAKSNLEYPDPPSTYTDLPAVEKSYDIHKTGRGRGGGVSLDPKVNEMRQPVVKGSSVREDGEELKRETFDARKGM